ncbi:hypothetical protein AVEN_237518-1 [Araneus ventricosus]|uniref:Uncharacterized protein n=1 Tax=Araneus ventricosus TaxID=182803 RepID=A0A4Y2G5R8_ARAVE|nr:hypothetical protein AVEN_237518-1 [Araneus ventricosus]
MTPYSRFFHVNTVQNGALKLQYVRWVRNVLSLRGTSLGEADAQLACTRVTQAVPSAGIKLWKQRHISLVALSSYFSTYTRAVLGLCTHMKFALHFVLLKGCMFEGKKNK